MNKTENNSLIAEFMGLKANSKADNRYFNTPDIYYKYDVGEYKVTSTATPEDMRYYISWDWLMPVVQKIESILPDDSVITIEYKDCIIPVIEGGFTIEVNGNTKIDAVYKAVVEYIQWYNQQKK